MRASKTGTYYLQVTNNGYTKACLIPYTIAAVGVWQRVTAVIPSLFANGVTTNWTNGIGLTCRFWLGSGSGNVGQTTFNQWMNYSPQQIGSNQVWLPTTTSDYWDITGLQLQVGTQATDFTRRANGPVEELTLCQRYFEKSYAQGSVAGAATATGGIYFWAPTTFSNAAACKESFAVVKRASPSVTIYNPANGNANQFYNGSTGVSYSASATNVTESNFLVNLGPAASLTQGQLGQWQWVAEAEL